MRCCISEIAWEFAWTRIWRGWQVISEAGLGTLCFGRPYGSTVGYRLARICFDEVASSIRLLSFGSAVGRRAKAHEEWKVVM